ncbi:MAG: hypothetical protein C0402_09835 [Thermodesulfovibrio sp.]|nr:hypothetical protein [Thermodesulfovibrio sp.]
MFYEGKSVLVTGGSGFVGAHIVQELLRQRAEVRVSVHERPLPFNDDRVSVVRADLTRQEDCLRAVRDVDFVFHAAGAVSGAAVTPAEAVAGITANLVLTAQMLQAAASASVERFLLFSSSTVYPVVDHPVKEDEAWEAPPHPSYEGYGWMRRYFEKLAGFVASKTTMKLAVVRPTAVYGRLDNFDPRTSHVVSALIRKAVERATPYEVWGSGDEVRDFLHVTDLARGCLLMLEKYATGKPLNLGYGSGATIREIAGIILEAANYHGARVVFNTSKPVTIPFRVVDTSQAKAILGFEPLIALRDGLTDTVRWYEEVSAAKT